MSESRMYVDQIDVTGFRGIKELDEPIELSDFTILVGRNNAGKSSLLEALYSCFGGRDPVSSVYRPKRVRGIHDSNLLYRYSGEGDIRLSGRFELKSELIDDRMKNIRVDETSESPQTKLDRLSDEDAVELLGFSVDTATMLFAPSYESYVSILDRIQSLRNEVEREGIHADAAEFINSQVDDEYTEIYLKTLEARKQPDGEHPFFIDLTDLGSGVLKTIAMYLAVETIEPAILLWDDMGTSLHPSLLAHVMEWLAGKDVQVVASTHSIDALSTFLTVGIEDGSVVQMSKSNDDVVSHTSLDLTELEQVMDNAGLDPRFLSAEFEV